MKNKTDRPKYSYPARENYSSEIHTNEGVGRLVADSYIERLLTELEDEGVDVSGPRAELTAIKNFVKYSNKFRVDVKNHALFLVNRCE
ncbi:hypothetical protein ACFFL1_05900 [Samsonia erythrinae]|uniref:Uncharacterized protein n=1 Tax=Samsonia erythrinae TaxID=160434 RepID=A0A4R3VFH1_9GAMM|nr:hypothetical protein [Samsonia erythrinae]TCV04167.1 hypothetical protein EDC54_11135 [Samsonia erythrinae]